MYENIFYRNPFLKEVILRVDFSAPLPDLEKTVPPKIAKKASKKFPIAEPQKALAQEFQFTGPTLKAKSTEVMQWIYHGREREKRLTITPTTLLQTSKKYKTFEFFIDDIRDVLSEFFTVYQDLSASRLHMHLTPLSVIVVKNAA